MKFSALILLTTKWLFADAKNEIQMSKSSQYHSFVNSFLSSFAAKHVYVLLDYRNLNWERDICIAIFKNSLNYVSTLPIGSDTARILRMFQMHEGGSGLVVIALSNSSNIFKTLRHVSSQGIVCRFYIAPFSKSKSNFSYARQICVDLL